MCERGDKMFEKPEDVGMTKEESEAYGRKINALSAKYENVEFASEATKAQGENQSHKLSEEEIKKRVGAQNFENMKNDQSSGSINS